MPEPKKTIPPAIEHELDAICASPVFASAPRMQQLLRFLVDKALNGKSHQLKAYTIGLEIFARDASFDPQADPVVRVEMRRLRNKLRSYYLSYPAGEVLIDIPKGGYIPDFIPAESPQCLPLTGRSSELLPYATSLTSTSVLITPFENLSPNKQMTDLGISLAAGLSASLAKCPGLSVTSQYYVRQMLDSGCGIQNLARQTKAGFVLSGNIQTQGPRLRLMVELAEAATGMLLSSRRFEYTYNPKELFTLQDNITSQVLNHLADYLHLTANFLQNMPAAAPDATAETYEAILQFSAWESSLNPELMRKARSALEQVVDEDNVYPQTAAMLADIYASEYRYGDDHTPGALDKSLALAEKALAKNPDYPIACLAKSMCYFLRHDSQRLRSALCRVLSLKINYSNVLSAAASLLIASGDLEAGKKLAFKVTTQDELMPWWHYTPLFILNYTLGNYQQALYATMRMRAQNSTFFSGPLFATATYAKLNMRADAEASLQELLRVAPDFAAIGQRALNGIFFHEAMVEDFVKTLEDVGLRL